MHPAEQLWTPCAEGIADHVFTAHQCLYVTGINDATDDHLYPVAFVVLGHRGHQMRTPPSTLCARRAASSMFANRQETTCRCSSRVRVRTVLVTTVSRCSRSRAHSWRNAGTSPGSTFRSSSASTGKNRAPSERTTSEPHTVVRQRSKPARSQDPSGTSRTCNSPSVSTTKTSTARLMGAVEHDCQPAVHARLHPLSRIPSVGRLTSAVCGATSVKGGTVRRSASTPTIEVTAASDA